MTTGHVLTTMKRQYSISAKMRIVFNLVSMNTESTISVNILNLKKESHCISEQHLKEVIDIVEGILSYLD